MPTIPTPGLLRIALGADAVMSGASGQLLVAASGAVAQATARPAPLLLAWLATRASVPRGLVSLLAGGNLAWAIACVAVPLLGLLVPSGLGIAFLAAQALAVAIFAAMYAVALRRAARMA